MTMIWIMSLTYGEAEQHFCQGVIDQVEWDLYRFYWRNGAFRFSATACEFDLKPCEGPCPCETDAVLHPSLRRRCKREGH